MVRPRRSLLSQRVGIHSCERQGQRGGLAVVHMSGGADDAVAQGNSLPVQLSCQRSSSGLRQVKLSFRASLSFAHKSFLPRPPPPPRPSRQSTQGQSSASLVDAPDHGRWRGGNAPPAPPRRRRGAPGAAAAKSAWPGHGAAPHLCPFRGTAATVQTPSNEPQRCRQGLGTGLQRLPGRFSMARRDPRPGLAAESRYSRRRPPARPGTALSMRPHTGHGDPLHDLIYVLFPTAIPWPGARPAACRRRSTPRRPRPQRPRHSGQIPEAGQSRHGRRCPGRRAQAARAAAPGRRALQRASWVKPTTFSSGVDLKQYLASWVRPPARSRTAGLIGCSPPPGALAPFHI